LPRREEAVQRDPSRSDDRETGAVRVFCRLPAIARLRAVPPRVATGTGPSRKTPRGVRRWSCPRNGP